MSYVYCYCTVEVMVLSTTPTTIDVTWSEAGSISLMIDFDIEISWERSSSDLCQYQDVNSTIISGQLSSATIHGLEEYSVYNITVSIGSSINNFTITETKESGKHWWIYCT